LASQTPPVRFLAESYELAQQFGIGETPELGQLREGVDYVRSAGGVPVMLRAVLPLLEREGRWRDPVWVALHPSGPERYIADGIEVHSVSLNPHVAQRYGAGKEKIWAQIHHYGTEQPTAAEFQAYATYNWRTASAMLDVLPDCDAAYVHDFQLLQVGALLGLSAPAVFRWHIPFQPRSMHPYLRNFIVRCLESYDAVVVSTKRDLEGLVEARYRGRAHMMYPYVQRPERTARPSDVQAFEAAWGLRADTPVVLVVGRMDPIKGQDRVLRALPKVLRRVPDARVVLVGDGSFTSARGSGLGHPKGRRWRAHLEATAAELGIEDHVIYTGYLPDDKLEGAWARADAVAVPSTLLGFGTTAIEAWMRKRPLLISRGAGAAELVLDGLNGFAYEPDDVEALADRLIQVLADRDLAERLGERGGELARVCELPHGAAQEDAVLRETIARFEEQNGPRPALRPPTPRPLLPEATGAP
jgi:glycosyltransferase involved in cell wall biosynthesis